METINNKLRVILSVLFVALSTMLWAGTNYDYINIIDPKTANVTYDEDGGFYKIRFVYYYNPTSSAKDVSLVSGSHIDAVWDNTKHKIMDLKGCSNCEHVDYSNAPQNASYGWIKANGNTNASGTFSQDVSDGSSAIAEFYYYPPEAALGKRVNIYFYFIIEQDEDGQGSLTRDYTYNSSVALPDITPQNLSLSHSYSNTVNKLDLKATYSGSSVPKNLYWGDVAFNGSNSLTKQIDRLASGSTFIDTIYLRFSEKVTKKVAISTDIKGYPAIKNFKATYTDDGVVNLKWDLETGTGNLEGGNFTIERALNPEFTNSQIITSTLPCNTTQFTDYAYDDDLVYDGIFAKTVYYRITRSITANSWGYNFGAKTSVIPNYQHVQITDAWSELGMIEDYDAIKIHWDYNSMDYIWSSGSSFIIERENVTAGTKQQITGLTMNDIKKGVYTDEAIQTCNSYRYNVYVLPGNTYFEAEKHVTKPLTPSHIGNILSSDASKGYFSDRIEIEWTSRGSFDQFTISRRLHNDPTGSWKAIKFVDASEVINNYVEKDETALPGYAYDYQIIGMRNCSDSVLTSDPWYATGFRTPTGDFYGRVTFESGQAEDSVEVRLETEDKIETQGLYFTKEGYAQLNEADILSNANSSITLQAWIKPDETSANEQHIIQKQNMYDLGILNGHPYFTVGNTLLNVDTITLSTDAFTHLTAVYDVAEASMAIYVNGVIKGETTCTNATQSGSNLTLGADYQGYMDEVRIWSRALQANEISLDYGRHIVGNEESLEAYYNFDYIFDNNFYDLSFTISDYHKHDGKFYGDVTTTPIAPSVNQLAYKAITDVSGTYSIRAVPYYGNGTAYTLTPRKGVHEFAPIQEIRFINENAQSHTVNFTDQSSFLVSGKVVYEGGNYPVEGASFTIDGVPALHSNGTYIYTDAKGEFEINVPVGVHEVMVNKHDHIFANGGRITTSNGQDRNYQDILTGIVLEDQTKIKYIGRVCGGAVQEAYPVGFGASKNNLADNMTVTLIPAREAYKLQDTENVHSDTIDHFVLSKDMNNPKVQPKTTIVDYNEQDITIHVNNETGEFVAMVYPEQYTIKLGVYGHSDITGDNSTLDLSQATIEQYESYNYTDSVQIEEGDSINPAKYTYYEYSDSIPFNQKQIFSKRYRAQIDVFQMNSGGTILPYFGEEKMVVTNLANDVDTVILFDKTTKTYTFGMPVFRMNTYYFFGYNIFEEFPYYIDAIGHTDPDKTDRVPVEDAEVTFASSHLAIPSTDEEDLGYWKFKVGEPDLTTAIGSVSATFTYGDDSNPTSVNWENPMGNAYGQAYVIGEHLTGTNFTTTGPNKMLTILRDPPGSNSYSYLEQGTSFSESSTYTGSVSNEGSETETLEVKQVTFVVAGTGAIGAITGSANATLDVETGATLGIEHTEEYVGSNGKGTNITITTTFQTSDDPSYVGANADVYIGYSTNLTFGTTFCTSIVPRSRYDSLRADAYLNTYYIDDKYAIVESDGISVAQNFSTLFAYTQQHIENILIPNLETLRNGLLILPGQQDISHMQDSADINKRCYYVSNVPVDSERFGQEGSYTAYLPNTKLSNGSTTKAFEDTISILNQSIVKWNQWLAYNDSVKIKANRVIKNYSFEGGAPIEYSEQYATAISSDHSFNITVGQIVSGDNDSKIFGAGTKFSFEEHLATSQGNEWSTEYEASHTKGFVLAEDGDDYLSVDVLYEDNNWEEAKEEYETKQGIPEQGSGTVNRSDLKVKDNYPTFVFRTRGGATSCPYEDEYTAIHWKGHETEVINAATVQRERPLITCEKNFVENIPSGERAYFTLNLRNNSDTGDDQWFDVMLDDQTNPDGAIVEIDGSPISGHRLEYLVPAGDNLVKTVTLRKGQVLNYDNLAIVLMSQCQADPTGYLDVIADTVFISAHFTPSCTSVEVVNPSDKWTYNTKCPVDTIDGIAKHYMQILLGNFDVNYADFEHIELQYKSSAGSDNDWVTLAYYYDNDSLLQVAQANGLNAIKINPEDLGTIAYKFYMDELPDQKYDIRAVSFCNINNILYSNPSGIISGIKDMYNPRLFGSAKPANGILTVEDEVRLDFNETIAEGLLTSNNFTVTGIRNGAATNHDVAIQLDGNNAYLTTELEKNYSAKDLTIEGWINISKAQNATIFSHGNASSSLAYSITADNHIKVRIGNQEILSNEPAQIEFGSWNNVALTYSAENDMVTAYVNWVAVIEQKVNTYKGIGQLQIGRDLVSESSYFDGKVDQFRVWNAVRTSSQLQANSAIQLSGNDVGLIAYYGMDEARGNITEDKARGVNLMLMNAEWALPDGFATQFDGTSGYLEINSGATVVTPSMDYTLEFWFKTDKVQPNATMISNGDGKDEPTLAPLNFFSIGWNSNGVLCYRNNGYETEVPGNWTDGQWHNFALTVSRSTGHARIYMDGQLATYISADMVGGIQNDKIYVGARGWYKTANDNKVTVDQFYTGSIDELRFWKLYRTQSQMESLGNEKLDGNELGLLFYYPFEHYINFQGVSELQYTLGDFVQEDMIITAKGTTAQTSDIAPVRTKGAVSSLLYDFVVNDDALIITLKEDDYRIENTIITFTAEDIRDVNGNSILSPITWSAYIDRNQLMWQEDEINVSKKQYEELTFNVGITNKGGFVQNYTIENLPSWLTASPNEGTLNPTKSQNIEFYVNPGLNVGTYNEVIYLVDAENVSEPLDVTVTVTGTEPIWNVNPSDFQYNMSIFGKMRMDGVFSNDENDILAAFDGNTCVGTAQTSYNAATDMYYVLLTIYSNVQKSSQTINFRMYDASTGTTYQATPSQTIKFSNNAIYGTPMDPIIFDGKDYVFEEIALNNGWNWISFNLSNPDMDDINYALDGTKWYGNEQIKTLDEFATYSNRKEEWIVGGGLTSLDNESMYMMKVNNDMILPISGSEIDPTTKVLNIKKNQWNWISYIPSNALSVKTAMAGYDAINGDIVKSQDGFAMYFGNEWVGSLTYMKPTEGYMLKNTSNTDKTLVYPSKASTVSQAPMKRVNSSKPNNMSIFGHYSDLVEGDVIYAIVNGEICGEAIAVPYENGVTLQCISVAGTDITAPVYFILVRAGETFTSTTVLDYKSNAIYGEPSQPVEIEFETINTFTTFSVYPIPAVTDLTVSAAIPAGESSHIEIYDLVGKKITYTAPELSTGIYVRNINISQLPEGAYMLRLVHGDKVEITKFVKF